MLDELPEFAAYTGLSCQNRSKNRRREPWEIVRRRCLLWRPRNLLGPPTLDADTIIRAEPYRHVSGEDLQTVQKIYQSQILREMNCARYETNLDNSR